MGKVSQMTDKSDHCETTMPVFAPEIDNIMTTIPVSIKRPARITGKIICQSFGVDAAESVSFAILWLPGLIVFMFLISYELHNSKTQARGVQLFVVK